MEFKGTKGKWIFKKESDADFERLTISDEDGNWIFYSDLRGNITIEEESNFLLASRAKNMLEMLEIIASNARKGLHLKHYDIENIEQLIKQATEI